MPANRIQEMIFGAMMSVIMVYGMEVYNAILRLGWHSDQIFRLSGTEMVTLCLIVFVIQSLIGVPLAKSLTQRLIDLHEAPRLMISFTMAICTVISMCPIMSLVATMYFKGVDEQILLKWSHATLMNLPMALSWQLFVAGPVVRFLFRTCVVRTPVHS